MPWFKTKLPIAFPFRQKPQSPEATSYRKLATRLLLHSQAPGCHTILVTSAEAGEGKSTTAINVATVLVEMNKRVILIDADLRRPTLHQTLELSNESGLTSYLIEPVTGVTPVVQASDTGLKVITSGPPLKNAGALSGFTDQLKTLINHLKSQADYIIVDTSPLLMTSDPLLLATLVDQVLLVVRQGKTKRQSGQAAIALLKEAEANILGIVLNDARPSLNGYFSS
jgi:capsular exopolysaccharide synthesis family protein